MLLTEMGLADRASTICTKPDMNLHTLLGPMAFSDAPQVCELISRPSRLGGAGQGCVQVQLCYVKLQADTETFTKWRRKFFRVQLRPCLVLCLMSEWLRLRITLSAQYHAIISNTLCLHETALTQHRVPMPSWCWLALKSVFPFKLYEYQVS